MNTETTVDFAVIGAGIAGAGVAAELAAQHTVALLEREDRPAYHTTGRSAALFSATYGPPPIRALSRASHAAFKAGGKVPFLSPRGAMFVARADQMAALDAMATEQGDAVQRLTAAEVLALCPIARLDYVAGGLLEPGAEDIDVDALHSHFLSRLRAAGGVLHTKAEVLALDRDGTGWRIETPTGTIRAGVVINAAGAWGDVVGAMAGAAPRGLVPKRRTALLVRPPEGVDLSAMPIAVDVEEQFYIKPDAGALLLSPADETPSEPCDAQPEELDIAICVDRIQQAFDLPVRRVTHSWAGLRSFVADKSPVAGFDAEVPGFFWLIGQGGYGIQTAPALSRLAAALATGQPVPSDILDAGLDPATIAPDRKGLGA